MCPSKFDANPSFCSKIRQLQSEYSFLRLEGLKSLIELLDNMNQQELAVFFTLQDVPDKNICLLAFKAIFQPQPSTSTKFTSPITFKERKYAIKLIRKISKYHHGFSSQLLLSNSATSVNPISVIHFTIQYAFTNSTCFHIWKMQKSKR